MAEPASPNLSLELVLGALLLLGILLAIFCACRRWKKTPKKAKAFDAAKKRGLDIDTGDKHGGDAAASADEMQPLVGGASELSSPTGTHLSALSPRWGQLAA